MSQPESQTEGIPQNNGLQGVEESKEPVSTKKATRPELTEVDPDDILTDKPELKSIPELPNDVQQVLVKLVNNIFVIS